MWVHRPCKVLRNASVPADLAANAAGGTYPVFEFTVATYVYLAACIPETPLLPTDSAIQRFIAPVHAQNVYI